MIAGKAADGLVERFLQIRRKTQASKSSAGRTTICAHSHSHLLVVRSDLGYRSELDYIMIRSKSLTLAHYTHWNVSFRCSPEHSEQISSE
jgi:predicted transcriptional regulator